MYSQLHNESHQHFDLNPPNQHTLNIDPKQNTKHTTINHQLNNYNKYLHIKNIKQINNINKIILNPTQNINTQPPKKLQNLH